MSELSNVYHKSKSPEIKSRLKALFESENTTRLNSKEEPYRVVSKFKIQKPKQKQKGNFLRSSMIRKRAEQLTVVNMMNNKKYSEEFNALEHVVGQTDYLNDFVKDITKKHQPKFVRPKIDYIESKIKNQEIYKYNYPNSNKDLNHLNHYFLNNQKDAQSYSSKINLQKYINNNNGYEFDNQSRDNTFDMLSVNSPFSDRFLDNDQSTSNTNLRQNKYLNINNQYADKYSVQRRSNHFKKQVKLEPLIPVEQMKIAGADTVFNDAKRNVNILDTYLMKKQSKKSK